MTRAFHVLIVVLAVVLLSNPASEAGTPYQVKDIRMIPAATTPGSSPEKFKDVGGITFFRADDGINGFELWRTDGTEAGTRLVKDVNPGRDGSYPEALFDFNGLLIFTAWVDDLGLQLWKSDGTAAGTTLLKAINPGGITANPRVVGALGDTLFFGVNDGVHGYSLWKSDGTEAGTVFFKDIGPGYSVGVVDGLLYFGASDADHGSELWKTDGTEAGTVLVKDINPGVAGSGVIGRLVDDTMFLTALHADFGRELWKSDGTETGTVLVKDISPGTSHSAPFFMAGLGDKCLFQADDGSHGGELWISDGTEAGTLLLKDIRPGDLGSSIRHMTLLNDLVLFRAYDGTHGTELWKTDGTVVGTEMVKDISVGSSSSNPEEFTVLDDVLYFKAQSRLWRSDGSEGGTVQAYDIQPSDLGAGSGYLFFAANDGTTGSEPWRSDGTTAGTVIVKDILQPSSSSYPSALKDVAGKLFFSARDDFTGTELWSSDGSEAGTALVQDLHPGGSSQPSNPTSLGGSLLFTARAGSSLTDLCRSDGTPTGTFPFTDRLSGSCGTSSPQYSRCPDDLTAAGDVVYLKANDGTSGPELWKTDGTDAGTVLVKDIRPGDLFGNPLGGVPREFTPIQDTVFFTADDGTTGRWLWKTDGTESGTVMVNQTGPGGYVGVPGELTAVGELLFFLAWEDTHGVEIWKSDGTESGTAMVRDIRPGPGSSAPAFYSSNLTAVGETLFFRAYVDDIGTELWKSDGSEAGTVLVKDIHPDGSSYPEELTDVDGIVFFVADDPVNGIELWKSDGSEAGTTIVQDICPGRCSSFPRFLTSVDGKVVFWASDASHGIELWESDGTEQGTRMVFDIAPGPTSSRPQKFTISGQRLFFVANGNIAGEGPDFELWAMIRNQSPVASAGFYQDVECIAPDGAQVTLDGSGSSDPDSTPGTHDDIVSFEWFEDYGTPAETLLGTGDTAAVTLALGTHELTLRVTDSAGATSTDETTVTVVDTTPPELTVDLTPAELWPPNHKMVDVQAVVSSTDLCGPSSIVLSSVSSNEADNGQGDGNTVNDIQAVEEQTPDFLFRLRAERAGGGGGRIYTAVYTATDGSGNSAMDSGFVIVVHDQGGIVDPIQLSMLENGSGSELNWGEAPDVVSYDVIRGDLTSIRETAVVIDLGEVTCIERDSPDPSTAGSEDPEIPAVGSAFFYLAEYDDGTSSSYGTESADKPRAPGAGDCD